MKGQLPPVSLCKVGMDMVSSLGLRTQKMYWIPHCVRVEHREHGCSHPFASTESHPKADWAGLDCANERGPLRHPNDPLRGSTLVSPRKDTDHAAIGVKTFVKLSGT